MIEKVNLQKAVEGVSELFQYLEIGKLNYHTLNVLQVENRTLDFHIHEKSDELFYVIEGTFDIELEEGFIPMNQGDMIIIPKGILHRPVCKSLVKCLIVNLEGTLNKKNTEKT
ncbi:MAG: cupin domain-containing protein [Methanobrevibacter sp.]|nr:cupin domain-containing protein [Methanobrevibacter sp.]